jgi:acetyltransferase-like isoleucine patch superfamily enzyme/acyl carrier protein
LIVGDYLSLEGKCSFMFAVRYSEAPTLLIGNHTTIGHGCTFTVGRGVSIGNHCLIASDVEIFDSPGHPTDPGLRKLGRPANPEDVRAITVEDNVWIGKNAIVFPGVTIGEGSVVAIGSHVMTDVPPYTLVAGAPARVIARLANNGAQENGTSHAPHKKDGNGSDSPEMLQEVTEVICSVVGIPRLEPDENFYDAGVTSIMVLPLLAEVEDKFQVSIPQEAFLNARTCRSLSVQIADLIGDQRLTESSLRGK